MDIFSSLKTQKNQAECVTVSILCFVTLLIFYVLPVLFPGLCSSPELPVQFFLPSATCVGLCPRLCQIIGSPCDLCLFDHFVYEPVSI